MFLVNPIRTLKRNGNQPSLKDDRNRSRTISNRLEISFPKIGNKLNLNMYMAFKTCKSDATEKSNLCLQVKINYDKKVGVGVFFGLFLFHQSVIDAVCFYYLVERIYIVNTYQWAQDWTHITQV